MEHLDSKKLQGITDIYRVRIGDVRVVFRKVKNITYILEVGKQSENIYKNV